MFLLGREWVYFKFGMMSTIFAGCIRSCCNSHCSMVAAVWPRGVCNNFVDAHLVDRNGSSGFPQLEVALESTIAVLMSFDFVCVIVIGATVAASSTCAVSEVTWV